jgi:membrane associated rhomboid family serine protease
MPLVRLSDVDVYTDSRYFDNPAMPQNFSDDLQLDTKMRQLMAEIESDHKQDKSIPSHKVFSSPRPSPSKSSWWQNLKHRFLLPLEILMIPWVQEIIDQVVFQGRWNLALHPRSVEGLPGIFLAAFSHGGFAHLIGNSIAFAIFSWLILIKSQKDFWYSFLIGWIGGGIVCWLLGPQSAHGLSGVVYTLFGYLLFIGWLEKRLVSLGISVFVLVNYSSAIWGIFPNHPMVAWWGHLFGFLLGIFTAYGVYREPGQKDRSATV